MGSLSEFRNNDIYQKSYEDRKKNAHIEEIAEREKTFIDDLEDTEDGTPNNIVFMDGYEGEYMDL